MIKLLPYIGTIFIDSGGLSVVDPGVVKHEPDIINILPGVCVLSCVQLALDCRQIHRLLHDVIIILQSNIITINGLLRQLAVEVRTNI